MLEAVGSSALGSMERAPWGWVLAASVLIALWKGWPAIADAATRAKTDVGDRRLSLIEKLEVGSDD